MFINVWPTIKLFNTTGTHQNQKTNGRARGIKTTLLLTKMKNFKRENTG